MRQPVISTSFVQDQKHATKSDLFQPIQPSQIATVLAGHGFQLVSLRTGRARNPDRQDHQTTIARYRHVDELTVNGQGLGFDIVFKIPHLYGALTGLLGLFRQVCTNGLVASVGTFESIKVKHLGNPMSQLDTLIPMMVAQRAAMIDQIKAMQARDVSAAEIADLARRIATLRLDGTKAKNVQYQDLIKVRRDADRGNDLFTVLNVIQENVMRYGVRYQTETTDQNNVVSIRNMVARPVARRSGSDIETVKSVDLNASIWDEAAKLLKAA